METLCLFLGKSILASGLLTLCYLLALRGKRLHQYNRFFLLSIFPTSLVIPQLHFRLFSVPPVFKGHLQAVSLFASPTVRDGIGASALQQSQQFHVNWLLITAAIVILISLTLLLILGLRIRKVRNMLLQYPRTQLEGINLVLTDSPSTPFAFLNILFWNKAIALDGEIGQLIFRHELAHIRQGHTYDKLICQVLTCILWFNPFYWFIQKELNIVHEFIADEYALEHRDTGTFALMLLQSYNKGNFLIPEHHFFSSTIKRRLSMLQVDNPPGDALWRKLMILPFVTGLILLFSFDVDSSQIRRSGPAKKKIVVLLDIGNNKTDGHKTFGYTPWELCLKSAKRIKELSPAYNVVVYLVNDRHKPLEDQIKPDISIALKMGNEPDHEQAKGDFNIYVSGESSYARESNLYSSAILDEMALNRIIPGIEKKCGHTGVPCNCNVPAAQISMQDGERPSYASITKEDIYLLRQAQMPAMIMVLGNRKSTAGIRQLTDESSLDAFCHTILAGIVQGGAEKENLSQSQIGSLKSGTHPWMYPVPEATGCKVQ